MKRTLAIIWILVWITQLGFAQMKRANRYFEGGDYLSAAELYEDLWKKDKSKFILEKLSECYYNTFQYEKAISSLSLLVKGRFKEEDKYYDNKYNFMHYQFLSATGDYERAIDYLVLFKNNRGIEPPRKERAKDEVETFRLKKADYKVEKASFNSDAADFSAVKFKDSVFFVSDRASSSKKYKWTHRPFLDIFSFKLGDKNKRASEISPVSSTLNSALHDGSFCFSKDGNTLYLSRSNVEEGKEIFDDTKNNNVQLYVTHKKNGKWEQPVKLPFNAVEYSFEHPALSPDEKRLYYSSNVLGSVGSYDLYYVTINDDGTYGSPKNLSYIINTENREQFPYISEEGHLFFSSNGHLGLGMLDVFVSEWVDGKFTKPINLGAPINSRYDDFAMQYYDARNGFFASNREHSNDDIYTFEQTGEIFIREYINQFEIRDKDTQEYVPNAEVSLVYQDSIIYMNTLDSLGQFNNNLLAGPYVLKAKAPGYDEGEITLNIREENDQKHVLYLQHNPNASDVATWNIGNSTSSQKSIEDIIKDKPKASQDVIKELLADKNPPRIIAKGDKLYFDMPPIYFDFDRWEIRADSKKVLDNLGAKLQKYTSITIRITSHTDNRGTDRYNQVLSEKRAESTRNYLASQHGIQPDRMSFKGYGESRPLVNCDQNCTEQEHQLNRRSEFEIVKY